MALAINKPFFNVANCRFVLLFLYYIHYKYIIYIYRLGRYRFKDRHRFKSIVLAPYRKKAKRYPSLFNIEVCCSWEFDTVWQNNEKLSQNIDFALKIILFFKIMRNVLKIMTSYLKIMIMYFKIMRNVSK